jgi:hypothetical protein
MPKDAKIRSASRAVVMTLLATSLCVATEAQAQTLPPLCAEGVHGGVYSTAVRHNAGQCVHPVVEGPQQ